MLLFLLAYPRAPSSAAVRHAAASCTQAPGSLWIGAQHHVAQRMGRHGRGVTGMAPLPRGQASSASLATGTLQGAQRRGRAREGFAAGGARSRAVRPLVLPGGCCLEDKRLVSRTRSLWWRGLRCERAAGILSVSERGDAAPRCAAWSWDVPRRGGGFKGCDALVGVTLLVHPHDPPDCRLLLSLSPLVLIDPPLDPSPPVLAERRSYEPRPA